MGDRPTIGGQGRLDGIVIQIAPGITRLGQAPGTVSECKAADEDLF